MEQAKGYGVFRDIGGGADQGVWGIRDIGSGAGQRV